MSSMAHRAKYSLVIILITMLLSPHILAKEKILVIHSWHDILWDRLWEKGLNDKLKENYDLVRFDLDALRQTKTQLQKTVKHALSTYRSLHPKLVILGDDIALKELGTKLEAENASVIYLGINHNPRKYLDKTHGKNFTGVIERPLYERSIRQIMRLFPAETLKVLLLNDSGPDEENVTDLLRIFGTKSSIKVQGVTIDLKITHSWEQWQQEVLSSEKNGYSAILFDSRYQLRDVTGQYVEPEIGVVRWMSSNSPLPIFSFYEDSIGPGLGIGGWVISGYEIGTAAGELALDLLDKEDSDENTFPVFYDKAKYIFSRTELNRWQIDLPIDIRTKAIFVEDLHTLWIFDCAKYDNSLCYQ
ncbi:MAG: hypothetical protein V7739_17170 [Motiliproteus sp.]